MAEGEIENTADAEKLQARLTGAARRRGVPDHEADDVAADAIAKAAIEAAHPGRPPFEKRASVALRDTVPEFFRKAERSPELLPEEALPEPAAVIDLTEGLRLGELCDEIHRAIGDEALFYAIQVSRGYTEAEIAQLPGWGTARAARVRKRIERQRGRLRLLRRSPEEESE
jgi:DNA-directed RNA polymerase specialized sigma24 family protein